MDFEEAAIEIFEDSKTLDDLYDEFLDLGFRSNLDGANKRVFIHPRYDYVFKILTGWDRKPYKSSKIYHYYVPSTRLARKRFKYINKYIDIDLLMQQKVKDVGNEDNYWKLIKELDKKGTPPSFDKHQDNVGILNGKIVIIDY